ncbi:MAG TPA: hypothetical protein VIF57_13690 [Polyangia bacterium]|jgi:hypothetical protein
MFPWLWINATKIRFPLSGEVAQDLSTDTFFQGIKPGAGVPAIEKQAFDQASYGKQLGWLTDVVLGALPEGAMGTPEARVARKRLEDLSAKIRVMKEAHRRDSVDAATALLDRMKDENLEGLKQLLRRYADVGT